MWCGKPRGYFSVGSEGTANLGPLQVSSSDGTHKLCSTFSGQLLVFHCHNLQTENLMSLLTVPIVTNFLLILQYYVVVSSHFYRQQRPSKVVLHWHCWHSLTTLHSIVEGVASAPGSLLNSTLYDWKINYWIQHLNPCVLSQKEMKQDPNYDLLLL